MKRSIGAKTALVPTPAWVVGSYDNEGKADMMTAAWGGIACSNPSAVTVSIRKERQTYANIMEKKAFTINVPSRDLSWAVDIFGTVSAKNADKIEMTRLSVTKSDKVDAPILNEFPLVAECKLIKTVELGAHTMFIGEIVNVLVEETLFDGDKVSMEQVQPLLFDTLTRSYYETGKYLEAAFQPVERRLPNE